MMRLVLVATFAAILFLPAPSLAAEPNADALLRAAFDNWRAKSSTVDVVMTVHRPDWQRTMEMKAWTLGDDDALVRFIAPAKDGSSIPSSIRLSSCQPA